MSARAAPLSAPALEKPGALDLVLFVSCVKDKPVSRLPLHGGGGSVTLIGAVRDGRRYVYDEEAVIALSRAEVEAHGRVYERAIREGYLRRRTREEWETWRAEQKKRAEQADKDGAEQANDKPAVPAGGEGL